MRTVKNYQLCRKGKVERKRAELKSEQEGKTIFLFCFFFFIAMRNKHKTQYE